MKIIAVANQKGGVGKTTTAVSLAACLAELGRRVVLVDLDPQGNATSALGLTNDESGLYPALIGESTLAEQVRNTAWPKLRIVPGSLDLAGCEVELARGTENGEHLTRLRDVLDKEREEFDAEFMLLDCPPSLGILMTNALAAADSVLIPLQCEYFALEGLSKILGVVKQISAATGREEVPIEGVLLTMYDARTNLSQQVFADAKEHLGEMLFKTIIPRTIRLGEAPSHGKPITAYDSNSVAAQTYRALAKEFLERQAALGDIDYGARAELARGLSH